MLMNKSEKKEAAVSFTKSLFSAIPYVGGVLNEVVFDYRSRIKQERLNSFTELLTEFFINNPDIDLENLKTEDFSDLFEAVLRRITQTKSKEKHKRFRDILTRHIQNPDHDIDDSDNYLDLVSSLNEMSIKILKEHFQFSKALEIINPLRTKVQAEITQNQNQLNQIYTNPPPDMEEINRLKAEIAELELQIDSCNSQVKGIQLFRDASYYGISDDDFLYYKQILLAKGLLVDNGVGSFDSHPFLYMGITEFGKKFIEFLLVD